MKRPALIASLCGALLMPAFASTPAVWEMNSYRDFVAGRLTGLSLTAEGRLTLAAKAETLFASDQPVIWSMVTAPDGTVYAGTGHRGRVFRVDKFGKASVVWTAEQPEVFALALDSKGVLYAGTSPDGAVYRIENGKASEYFAPKSKYIWSLAFGSDGALYAGTGDEGKVFRIESAGKGDVYYETGQSHVTCLAFDREGRLLAGSEPNGLIYRITGKDKAFVLYDTTLPEVRTLVPGEDGAIYAVALGGSMGRRALGGVTSTPGVPSSVSVSGTTATVTVEASNAQRGVEIKPKPDAAKVQTQQGPTQVIGAAPVPEISGVEKSAIYRISPDNTVESLWSSKEENIYDLVVSGGHVVFSTDGQGRIYRLERDRNATLLAETNEGEAIRLANTAQGLVAATGDMGKLYRLAAETASAGAYESPVHDANTVARWGRLGWRGELPDGGRVVLRTRTGNSVRPDKTWSDWSEPLTDPNGSPVKSPNARYIQWKAEFSGTKTAVPAVENVSLAYLPQNTPPVVRTITVTSQAAGAAAAATKASQTQAAPAYTVTVSDSPDSGTATSSGTPTQPVTRSGAEQLQLTWQAEDPDGDRLTYSVYFRGEGEREWKLLKANLTENTYAIDADSLADGKYFFRVVASDGASNSPETARTAESVSPPTLVDHTPPVVVPGTPRREGQRLILGFEASDAASPIRRAEYSVDAAPWIPIDPVDGIPDSQRERFEIHIDNLPAGEHLIVMRAVDSANNAGLAKTVVR